MNPNNPNDEQPTNQTPSLTPPTAPITPETPLTPAPQPVAPPVVAQGSDPGKTLGIISLVLAFIGLSLVGLILAIVAKTKSSKAGFKNTLAVVSIVINSIFLIVTPIILLIMLTAYGGVQGLAKDKLTYAELSGLNQGLNSYITEKRLKPASLSDVVSSTPSLNESYLTDSDGNAYTLSWKPDGCSTLTSCTAYTLSGDSSSHKGEKISITVDGMTGKTTYVNRPTSSKSE